MRTLVVKKSGIPGAGKGLFTRLPVQRGTRIVEYKGKRTTWKDVNHDEGTNRYIFYITRHNVIDAGGHKKALARYANDAKGLKQVRGLQNNATYEIIDGKPYIVAAKDIAAGSEILVSYGKEYWETVKYNSKIAGDKR